MSLLKLKTPAHELSTKKLAAMNDQSLKGVDKIERLFS